MFCFYLFNYNIYGVVLSFSWFKPVTKTQWFRVLVSSTLGFIDKLGRLEISVGSRNEVRD